MGGSIELSSKPGRDRLHVGLATSGARFHVETLDGEELSARHYYETAVRPDL
jgi:hypothetical protein